MEWVAEMVVVWVRLGTEMEVVLLDVEALVWVKRKRKKRTGFQWGRRRRMGAGCSGFSRSLLNDKRRGRRRRLEALSSTEGVKRAVDFKFHRQEAAAAAVRTGGGDGN